MVAYQAEGDLVRMVAPHDKRAADERLHADPVRSGLRRRRSGVTVEEGSVEVEDGEPRRHLWREPHGGERTRRGPILQLATSRSCARSAPAQPRAPAAVAHAASAERRRARTFLTFWIRSDPLNGLVM